MKSLAHRILKTALDTKNSRLVFLLSGRVPIVVVVQTKSTLGLCIFVPITIPDIIPSPRPLEKVALAWARRTLCDYLVLTT